MSMFGLLFLVTYAAMGFFVGSVSHAIRVIKAKAARDPKGRPGGMVRSAIGDFLFWPLALCFLGMRIASVGIRHATRAVGADKHIAEL